MPAQNRLWTHQQPESVQRILRQPVQQGSQERPVAREEAWPGRAWLPLQDRDLVTQHQDLRVLIRVAHWQEPQQREHVRHAEVDQSQQYRRSSCRSWQTSGVEPATRPRRNQNIATPAATTAPTWADEISAGTG